MVFNPNRPIATELLSDSQPLLLSNNQDLDTSFGIDHYKFSDATANNGFHNKVTTPSYVATPPTGLPPVTGANPILFGWEYTANVGMLQYSRGPSNAVPTPITNLYSPSTPITIGNSSNTLVLDFTGISLAQAILTFTYNLNSNSNEYIQIYAVRYRTGPIASASLLSPIGLGLTAQFSGSILSIVSSGTGASTNLYWSLNFVRIQV